MHIRLIYIDKAYFVFSKGWVVSLDYGTTAIVALLSGQLQVHIENHFSYIETCKHILFNADDVWSKGTVQKILSVILVK